MANTSKTAKGKASTAAQSAGSRVRSVRERLRKDLGPAARSAGKQIGKAFRATAKAAGKTTKIVSLRTQTSARELRIRGLFYKIGEAFYRAQKAGKSLEDNASALYPLLDQVDKLSREIFVLKQKEKAVRSGK